MIFYGKFTFTIITLGQAVAFKNGSICWLGLREILKDTEVERVQLARSTVGQNRVN